MNIARKMGLTENGIINNLHPSILSLIQTPSSAPSIIDISKKRI